MSNLIEKETAVLMVNVAERYIVEKGLTVSQGMTWLRDHIYDAEAGSKLVAEPGVVLANMNNTFEAGRIIGAADQAGRMACNNLGLFYDYAEIAKRCKSAASDAIHKARIFARTGGKHREVFKHREVELIEVGADQGGKLDTIDWFNVHSLSGKQIRQALAAWRFEPGSTWALTGGVDGYEDLQASIDSNSDYDPSVETWDVDPDQGGQP